MFRKILASVLCLMLALAMPLSSFAATDVTARIIPGDEIAAAEETVANVLGSLIFHVIADEEGAMKLALESTSGEIVSAAMSMDENGFFVSSPLLGERTLYFDLDDIAAVMTQTMKQQGMSDEEIAQFQQAMGSMTMPTNFLTAQEMDEDELEAMLLNDPAMVKFIESIEKKTVVTEGSFTDAAHNPATTKTEVTMDSSDIALLMDAEIYNQFYASFAQSAGMNADEMAAKVKELLNQMDINYNIVTYTAGEDDVCAAEMDMTIKGELTVEVADKNGKTSTQTANLDMVSKMTMNVLTNGEVDTCTIAADMTNNGTGSDDLKTMKLDAVVDINDEADTYGITGVMTVNDDPLNFKGALTEGENDAVKGWLALLADSQQLTFTVDANKADETQNVLVSLMMRENATDIVEPTWSDKALMSIALQIKDVETPAELAALKAATPETALQLLKMSETELNNEMEAISADAMSALFAGLANLPPELLSLMMTEGN